ncbi:MAG: energy-coupling factor transporter ATPase [Bacillota bacterium]
MGIVEFENVEFKYDQDSLNWIIDGVSLDIKKGSFVAVLGKNGSGKSTFARLINALVLPGNGKVRVDSFDTADHKYLWEIRRKAGMVFQNPDNQIVCTIVEEDVAFGLENLGVESEKIRKRVADALATVGLTEFKDFLPHSLSGGQKQRVAIAGLLAMRPDCIILDEATAMLDPVGRQEILGVMHQLNKVDGLTVILITHHMNEALDVDRVIVFDEGKIVVDGEPGEVFSHVEKIRQIGLDVPNIVELFYELNKEGFDLPTNIHSIDEAVELLNSKLYLQLL